MSARFLIWGLLGLAGYASLVTAGGGGVDNPADGICDASAVRQGGDIARTPGCNPNVGQLVGRCVALPGDGWAAPRCGADVPDGPSDVHWVEAPAAGALSNAQIRQAWLDAGGNPSAAGMAVAIARAESGGRTDAVGHNTNGTVDRGLWQINSIHGARSTTDLGGNARAAVVISSNGSNWGPWTTYTSGAYRRFLGADS